MVDKLSIVIPVYNEQDAVGFFLDELYGFLKSQNFEWEIVIVNDASSDDSLKVIEEFVSQKNLGDSVKIVNQPFNRGYGASIKRGIVEAGYDWVLTIDADGQHIPSDIGKLVSAASENVQMVIGTRDAGHRQKTSRKIGKAVLGLVARYLTGHRLPDLTSGLRLFQKKYFVRYFNILPRGFSLSTTSAIAFLNDGLNVVFVPIDIRERKSGKSKVRAYDGLRVIMLIMRLVMIFAPLRVFLPMSFVLFLIGLASLVVDIINFNISDTTVLMFVSSLIIFFFGLIADQIAALRRQ